MFECLLSADAGLKISKTDVEGTGTNKTETNKREVTALKTSLREGPLNTTSMHEATDTRAGDLLLSGGGIERLPYPLLLEATNAERLFLSFNCLEDSSVATQILGLFASCRLLCFCSLFGCLSLC